MKPPASAREPYSGVPVSACSATLRSRSLYPKMRSGERLGTYLKKRVER